MDYVNLTPDYTGANSSYKAVDETYDFGANTTRRVIMPRRGAFFSNSVQLVEVSTGRPLVKGADFEFAEIEIDATKASGKEVCCYIIVSNNEVANPIRLAEYQFVGGYFSLMPELLADVTALLSDESNPVPYKDIVGKPIEGLTPEFHEHGEDNTFNWQYVVSNLERLRYALTVKHDSMHELLMSRISAARASINLDFTPLSDALDAHSTDYNNPHQLTPLQADVFEIQEIDDFLDAKLGVNETAVDSNLFSGKTLLQLQTEAKYQVPVANFVSGIFDPARLGPNSAAGGERILTSEGWKPIGEVANPINGVIWMGSSSLATVKTSLAAAPVGTKASYLVYYNYSVAYANGGASYGYAYYREIAQKVDELNNWSIVGG